VDGPIPGCHNYDRDDFLPRNRGITFKRILLIASVIAYIALVLVMVIIAHCFTYSCKMENNWHVFIAIVCLMLAVFCFMAFINRCIGIKALLLNNKDQDQLSGLNKYIEVKNKIGRIDALIATFFHACLFIFNVATVKHALHTFDDRLFFLIMWTMFTLILFVRWLVRYRSLIKKTVK